MPSMLYHVGLTVSDMERSRRFYEGAFGFTFDRDLHMSPPELQPLLNLDPPSSIYAVYLMLGDFTLELMQWQPAARSAAGGRNLLETGLTHLSIVVDDIPATTAKAVALGATALADIGGAALLRDPDGQLIELIGQEIYAETARGRAERAAQSFD